MKTTEKSQLVKNIVSGSLRFEDRYISDRSTLDSVVKTLKQSGYRIVLTQGVYDLFHVGHKRYLEAAKSHGDILIIGVDTDELTRKRKGPNRPFDWLNDRLEILASLRTVDIVTTRDHNEHIYDLIRTVKPDVLVMSQTTEDFKDKDRQNLLRYCGDIQILPAQASTTTTAKLRRMMVDGAEQLGIKITTLINDFLKGINHESGNPVSPGNSHRASRLLQKTKARQPVIARKKSHR
ncbi:adenylyltransferase/cytidyltransferase family protein [Candidatus Parcubacteria bacterium]|nr:adenylyltransferase/cytidyltransferase family protein [Candidatus Parcubacteria bacterium]